MRTSIPFLFVLLAAPTVAYAAEAIPVPAFRSVQLRGGGQIILKPGSAQRVTIVEGSSRYTRVRVERDGRLRIDACNARCPQFYRLRIEIESPRVPDVAVLGGGAIRAAAGFAPQRQLSAAVDGGGDIDARTVEATSVSAAVNGGGRIKVRARSSLSAAINGGGSIRYAGNPRVSSAVRGGGAVQRGF
jgi:hypothetical protein